MKSALVYLVVLSIVVLAAAYPSPIRHNPEEGNKFEGDMLLNDAQQRNGLRNEFYRWPEGKVYYKFFEDHHDAVERAVILNAMKQISDATCITFHPATTSTSVYLNITAMDDGCYAHVGYYPAVRIFNLQKVGCVYLGVAIHELVHGLGFHHQHGASDRDEYITILLENVQEGMEYAFDSYPPSEITDFGISYDYGSVMHYGPTAFSKNGNPTIVPLDPTARIGQREGLSAKDITKLNIMYKCPGYV